MPTLLAFLLVLLSTNACARAPLRVFDHATTEQVGRALYDQERRVAIASDLLSDNFDVEAEHIVGYITSGDAQHMVVRYLRRVGQHYESAVDAVFTDLLLPVLQVPSDPVLSAAQMAQAAARGQVSADVSTRCDGRYNTLVVPDPDGEGMLVYAIADSEDPTKLMLGGHVRFTLSADGQTIENTEPLATSCTAGPRKQLEEAAATHGKHGLSVRNLLAATPLESHVLLSLLYGLPLFVVTSDLKMWEVAKGKMSVLHHQPGPHTP